MIALAEALARDFRTEEAIEQYWRSFDRTTDLDSKLGLVARLADLHLQRNQVDRLIARLERLRREEGKQREGSLYLAQAFAAIGDYGTARGQLEGLLAANARDTALLKQLAKLAEDEGDLPAAVKFQKQLCDVAPSDDAAHRLVQLALRSGDLDVAEAIWSKATEVDNDLSRVLNAIDLLMIYGKSEEILATTSRLLRKAPGNWELLYREGRALLNLDRFDEAAQRFRDILELRRSDDEVGVQVKARQKMSTTASALNSNPGSVSTLDRVGIRFRRSYVTSERTTLGLDSGVLSLTSRTQPPQDFAQARIFALGSLLVKARRDRDESGWLARRSEARAKNPNDLRLLWDDYYLSLLRLEYREAYETARVLVRASGNDPSAEYEMLFSMVNRNSAPGVALPRIGEIVSDTSPAMPANELDMVRDAYLSLVRNRPTLIAGATQKAVENELKKANRLGEIEGAYRDLLASAKDLDTYASVAGIAAARGDLDALRTLSELFFRLPASARANPLANQPYFLMRSSGVVPVPGYFLSSATRTKPHPEILRVLDEELASLRSPSRVAERARTSKTSTPTSSQGSPRYALFATPTATGVAVDFPTAGLYLDNNAIQLLRNTFALFQRDDLISDLRAHLKTLADASTGDPSADVTARLAYASVLWWAEERDEAIRELARASDRAPNDVELKLTLAELRAQRREPDEALTVLDSIEVADQDVTRRRELLALRAAVQAGRSERASQAAERLFGLRLDNPTQVQLASQMQQLGMTDLADAVLARARRRVGNDTDALMALMNQYQRMGNVDTATQIALQILRRTAGGPAANRVSDLENPAEQRAIQILAGSGKLDEMIDRVEAQRKLSPQSVPILQTLTAYYRAANRPAKLKEISEAMIRLRPDDSRLRLQLATQLAQANDIPAAIEQYRAVLKKTPALLNTYVYEIANVFRRANKLDEFVKLIDEIGIKSITSYGSMASVVQGLLNDPKTVNQGMSLLGKLWDALPLDRMQMLYYVNDCQEFWKRPEATTYAREGIIAAPNATNFLRTTWFGINTISTRNLSGDRIDTPSTRLLDVSSRDELEGFAVELASVLSKRPGWLAGKAIIGMIRLRQGRIDEGKQILEAVLADPGAATIDYESLVIIAQELRDIPATTPLALSCYERAFKDPSAWSYTLTNLPGSAVRQLALLYRKAGRNAEARSAVAKALENLTSSLNITNATPFTYHRKVVGLASFGSLALELDDPAGAIRAYHQLLDGNDDIQQARAYLANLSPALLTSMYTSNSYVSIDTLLKQARDGIERALHGMNGETLASTLPALVAPGGEKAPDLVLLVHPREVDRSTVTSLFTSALELAIKQPQSLSKVRTDLDSIAKARPDDIEVQIAAALATCAGVEPGSEAVVQAANRLDRLIASTPLEPLSEGAKANSRQRLEAAKRLGLWLVARTCWAHESTREVGDRLAASAFEAARRQVDNLYALAMLREWGRQALDRGDRKLAESRWASLLDLILANAPAPAAPSASTRPQTSTSRPRTPVLTLDRFEQAVGLARLSSENGMNDLSTRAIRESLKGGPPVVPVPMISSATAARTTTVNPAPDLATPRIEALLVEIDALWTRQGMPPLLAYETLRDVVLPLARPNEILLYNGPPERAARPSSTGSNSAQAPARTSEVGRILARRAIAADRVQELRDRIGQRQNQPAAKASGKALLDLIEAAEKESH